MKEIDPVVLWWVAVEFLGAWLWLAVVVAVLWLGLLAMTLRGGAGRVSARSQLMLGGAASLLAGIFLPALTDSAWTRINGATDWIALILAALAAGVSVVLLAYPLGRWLASRRDVARP
jgi:hypothetical protein